MKAIRLTGPVSPDAMPPQEVPEPELKPGFVLVRVKAFGVNESEVTSRRGESSADFSFPRILGIEGAGIVEQANPGSRFAAGQPVIAMMGGMGREYDGSYAQIMAVREDAVVALDPEVVAEVTAHGDWSAIGALPEMAQTAYGTLTKGCGLRRATPATVLVHGGTSSVGLMCIVLAKWFGATVIATSRSESRLQLLRKYGADHALVDDDRLRPAVKELFPEGIDAVAGFAGIRQLLSDTSLLKQGGKACFTGALDGIWQIDGFSPFAIAPGTYLTSYAGEAKDLPSSAANDILRAAAAGELSLPIARVYHGLEEVGHAQDDVERHTAPGKHVVVLD